MHTNNSSQPRLLIISDIWGAKKQSMVTNLLSQAAAFFQISFQDAQLLSSMDSMVEERENLERYFEYHGLDIAVSTLLQKETKDTQVLAFGIGAEIARKAALLGLPATEMLLVSGQNMNLHFRNPNVPVKLIHGALDPKLPDAEKLERSNISMTTVPNFGTTFYSDSRHIPLVCQELLELRHMNKMAS